MDYSLPRNGGTSTSAGLEAQRLYDHMGECANTLADIKEEIAHITGQGLTTLVSLDNLVRKFFAQLKIAQDLKNCHLNPRYKGELLPYTSLLSPLNSLMEKNLGAVQTSLTSKYQKATEQLTGIDKITDWWNKSPIRDQFLQLPANSF